jgi:transcriptional regulator with XRE-family HTH domain
MTDRRPPLDNFRSDFCARTARARLAKNWTQQQMADALAVELSTYQKYEKRTPLPHHLVYRFCLICEVEMEWLFTGRSRLPLPQQNPPSNDPQVGSRTTRRRTRI